MYPTTKNIVLGAGHVYFDKTDANGNLTGERYLAETPGFSIAVNAETLEAWSDDGAIAEKLLDVPTKVTRDSKLQLKNIDAENIAMFVIATASTQSSTAGSKTATPINGGNGVTQGRWYQLGVSANQPTGARGVSNIAIKDAVPTTYTLNTDYKVDEATGRIYIVIGGNITTGTVITGDYDEATVSWEEITSNDLGAEKGALRFVADNTQGANRDVYLPSVVMTPDGELAWKSRDTIQQMGFALSVLKPSDGRAAVYVNGRAA